MTRFPEGTKVEVRIDQPTYGLVAGQLGIVISYDARNGVAKIRFGRRVNRLSITAFRAAEK